MKPTTYKNVDRVYKDMVEEVLKEGNHKPNRTGIDTLSKFGLSYKLDISESFPLVSLKYTPFKSIVAENIWFLSGEPTVAKLHEWDVHFWDDWADENGNLETSYGRYWRKFPAMYEWEDGEAIQTTHVDQIDKIIKLLKNNPNSRRMVLSAWHPSNAHNSKLPPCHFAAVWNVQDGDKLNCHLTQRSGDIGLGIPFNIAGYAFLTHEMADHVGLTPNEFSHTIVDAHVYENHISGLKEMLERPINDTGNIYYTKTDDAQGVNPFYQYMDPCDFILHNYEPQPKINLPVAV